jgi:hypothetical protein
MQADACTAPPGFAGGGQHQRAVNVHCVAVPAVHENLVSAPARGAGGKAEGGGQETESRYWPRRRVGRRGSPASPQLNAVQAGGATHSINAPLAGSGSHSLVVGPEQVGHPQGAVHSDPAALGCSVRNHNCRCDAAEAAAPVHCVRPICQAQDSRLQLGPRRAAGLIARAVAALRPPRQHAPALPAQAPHQPTSPLAHQPAPHLSGCIWQAGGLSGLPAGWASQG